MNNCFRGAPCLFANQVRVPKEAYWDYYDREKRAFVYLDCRIHQKYRTPSLLEIEEADKYYSGTGTAAYETPDLQLSDHNGRWMTRSDDPECYTYTPFEETKTCSICDLVCEVRDDDRYLNSDGSCPYPESNARPVYWKIAEGDTACQEFLHPMLLQNIEAVNRKRRKRAKAHIWKHLQKPEVMHSLINSGQRIVEVWKRNYTAAKVYYKSIETVYMYLKSLPRNRQSPMFISHVFRNLQHHPEFNRLMKNERERHYYNKIRKRIHSTL